uniref:Uncharacterized protein n=1 Tax=viral metagenome TaxID=1070528 RepID=A0A6M3LAD8_9ZZZZ
MEEKNEKESIHEFEKNYPIIWSMIQESHACGGAGRPEFVHLKKDWKIPDEYRERLERAEEIAQKYVGVKFSDIWEIPKEVETIDEHTEILDYAGFPEDGDWTLFLEKFPEFKEMDEVIFQAFDGELVGSGDGMVEVKIPKKARKEASKR